VVEHLGPRAEQAPGKPEDQDLLDLYRPGGRQRCGWPELLGLGTRCKQKKQCTDNRAEPKQFHAHADARANEIVLMIPLRPLLSITLEVLRPAHGENYVSWGKKECILGEVKLWGTSGSGSSLHDLLD